MNTPLRYQITEYDCGTTSLLNAISYIFQREHIPAEIIHSIMIYTLDNFSKKGIESEGGTSIISLEFLEHWINQFATCKRFPIKLKLLKNEGAILEVEKASKLFEKKGCILVSVWLMKSEHYVIITNIEGEYAYIFDPYYVDIDYFSNNNNVEIIQDKPFKYNRKVKITELFSNSKNDYSLILNNNYQELLIIEKETSYESR